MNYKEYCNNLDNDIEKEIESIINQAVSGRKNQKITIARLCEILGTQRNAIYRIETGAVDTRLSTFIRYLNACNLKIDIKYKTEPESSLTTISTLDVQDNVYSKLCINLIEAIDNNNREASIAALNNIRKQIYRDKNKETPKVIDSFMKLELKDKQQKDHNER